MACLLFPPLSLASQEENWFPVNVYSIDGVSYPEEWQPRGHWLKNTQDAKLLMLIQWWIFLFVCLFVCGFLEKEQADTHNVCFRLLLLSVEPHDEKEGMLVSTDTASP